MPSFPVPVLLAAVALVLGVLAGHAARRLWQRDDATAPPHAEAAPPTEPPRRVSIASPLLDIVIAGVASARVAFVVQWWPRYREEPWSIVRLGDGGYVWWAALPAALVAAAWAWRKSPALRGPLLVAAAVASIAFALMMGVRYVLTAPGAPLPEVTLHTAEGKPVPLQSFKGRPVVLNLWATWCGPCRREMPALAQAQARHPGVHFVFANQGETQAEIIAFLQQAGLTLGNSLRDGGSQLSMALTARALPTTAFYDAQGNQVRIHVGELTGAAIEQQLQAMDATGNTESGNRERSSRR